MVELVRSVYGEGFIPLHRPVFEGNEREYLVDCIDSNFVSSVGARVTEFEQAIAAFVATDFAVATTNGTSALHLALHTVGVRQGDEVISQALTFVATCNAISYLGATPVLLDVDKDTLGLSPQALRRWLEANTRQEKGHAVNIRTGARVAACVPMHTFGLPCRISKIQEICAEHGVVLIEDAAESLGSYVGRRHTGGFGRIGTFSFNGNKIITTGGGGMIVTDDEELAIRAKHLSTTAKRPHPWEFIHDEVAFNYRLPNLNAALGCAQMECLPAILDVKREVAERYRAFCADAGLTFLDSREGSTANYWLNGVVLDDRQERDDFLEYSNGRDVMTRPVWRLMSELPAFADSQTDALDCARWLADRVVSIPSSVPDTQLQRIRP